MWLSPNISKKNQHYFINLKPYLAFVSCFKHASDLTNIPCRYAIRPANNQQITNYSTPVWKFFIIVYVYRLYTSSRLESEISGIESNRFTNSTTPLIFNTKFIYWTFKYDFSYLQDLFNKKQWILNKNMS